MYGNLLLHPVGDAGFAIMGQMGRREARSHCAPRSVSLSSGNYLLA